MALSGGSIGYGVGLQGKPKDYAGLYQQGLALYGARERAKAKQQATDAEKYAAAIKPADNMLPAFGNANVEDMANTLAAVQEDVATSPNLPVKRQRIISEYKGRTKLLQDANYATQTFINAGDHLTDPQQAVRSLAITAKKPEDIIRGIANRQDYQLRDETGKPFIGVTVGPDGSIAQGERNPNLKLQTEFQNMFQKWQLETAQELQQKNIGSTTITQITARMPETRAEAEEVQRKYGLSYVPSFDEKITELYKNHRFYTQNKLDSYDSIVDVATGNLKVAPEEVEKKLFEDFRTRGKLGLGVGTLYKVNTTPGAGQKAASKATSGGALDPMVYTTPDGKTVRGSLHIPLTYNQDVKEQTLPSSRYGTVYQIDSKGKQTVVPNVPDQAHISGGGIDDSGREYVEVTKKFPSMDELKVMNADELKKYIPQFATQDVIALQSELYSVNNRIAQGVATQKDKDKGTDLANQLEEKLVKFREQYASADGSIRYQINIPERTEEQIRAGKITTIEEKFNQVSDKKFNTYREQYRRDNPKKAVRKVAKNNTVGIKPEL